MKRIIKIAIDTILYAVIAILLFYVVLRAANQIGIYRVMTGSMEDGIHAGDYIIVKYTKDLKVGDVITYTRSNYYITHRIVEMTPQGLITKGDANNTSDDPVQMDEVVGKVIYKSALIKFIVTYKFILIGVFVLLFIASSILGEINKRIKKEENDEEIDNNEKIENEEELDNDSNEVGDDNNEERVDTNINNSN